MPERTLIGRIMRAERLGFPPYGRTSFEVDAMDMSVSLKGVAAALSKDTDPGPFAVVRIVTTQRRLNEILGLKGEDGDGASEGCWVHLEIGPSAKRMPITYHAQLERNGYSRMGRGGLISARFLFRDDEIDREPRPLSAQVASPLTLAYAIANNSQFPSDAIKGSAEIRRILRGRGRPQAVIVRDVGQASFVTAVDKKSRQLFHFDAGWPIAFNGKTAPKAIPVLTPSVPVILSHWDFDHLLGFYRFPVLQMSDWIVPVQKYGPGARRIANQLHAHGRLHGYHGRRIQHENIDLFCCQGHHPMNDTGFAITVTLATGRRVSMIGDATYSCAILKGAVHGLVVTHHGADFEGPAVRAAARQSPAIVSVGRGNVYRHPRSAALAKHRISRWSISFTMSRPGKPRGDRILL